MLINLYLVFRDAMLHAWQSTINHHYWYLTQFYLGIQSLHVLSRLQDKYNIKLLFTLKWQRQIAQYLSAQYKVITNYEETTDG